MTSAHSYFILRKPIYMSIFVCVGFNEVDPVENETNHL